MRETRGGNRYLAFELDLAGFNNVLMQLEVLTVLSWLTGRTLVLPPARPINLLGEEAWRLGDFFDIAALGRQVAVARAEEVWPELGTHAAFHAAMRERGYSPGWNALDDVLLHPASAVTDRLELINRLHQRRCVAIGARERDCEILYFPSTMKERMFGVFEAFYLFADPANERRARAVVRDGVRYRTELVELAERAAHEAPLAGAPFSAMHVRRGDFTLQYAKTAVTAGEIVRHTEKLLAPGTLLYLATDENDAAFWQPLAERFRLVRFADLAVARETPAHWVGIVETLVCAMAPYVFVGTRLSTFSRRIATLRGHISYGDGRCAGIGTALYYTQPPINGATPAERQPYPTPAGKHADPHGETATPWWVSIHREPLWARAYESTWREI